MNTFRLKDYQNKNILIIGNKPIKQLSKEQIDFINSFDIIIRVNGMNNLNETRGRVDWWWLNVWNWEVLKNNIGNKDYSSTKVIFIDKESANLCTKNEFFSNLPLLKDNILCFYTQQLNVNILNQEKYWIPNIEEKTIPTTDIICISYMITKFPNIKLYLTCLDIDEREILFKTHSNWKNTWHENVGGLESDYLKNLINNNKIYRFMKTCICVIIKDEEEYLDEWISHHLQLGIDEIFLYEDYGSKSHSDIVKPYGDKVHLNSIDIIFNSSDPNKNVINTGERMQIQLFNYFPQMYKNDFDWILFNDLDEFLILKQPLHELLEEYKDETAILLRWKWYGASGHINKPLGKVMDNYTKQITTTFDWGWQFKSFINCKKFQKWEKHLHKAEGAVFPLTEWGGHKAWINHYFTKSWEEWKIKILDRGDSFPGNRKIEHFFQLNKDLLPMKEILLKEINNKK
jgi:hypothetical protein